LKIIISQPFFHLKIANKVIEQAEAIRYKALSPESVHPPCQVVSLP